MHEDARSPILAGVDTSPVLKPSEHMLDLVTAAVEQDVMRDQHFQVGECGTEPVGVATPVSGPRFGLWKGIDHERRTLMIAPFPLAHQPPLAVANPVQLRFPTGLSRTTTRGTAPLGYTCESGKIGR